MIRVGPPVKSKITEDEKAKRRSCSVYNMVKVHQATKACSDTSVVNVEKIALDLKMSGRSVWRIIKALRNLYDLLESKTFDK